MDESRILLIGVEGPFRTSSFSDPPNLAEFGAVVWYPHQILEEWKHFKAKATIERLLKLIEWIKSGNALIVVGAPPTDFSVSYRSGQTETKFNFQKSEIFSGVTFRSTSGVLLEYCGPTALEKFLSSLPAWLSYNSILSAKDIIPLFRVSTARNQEVQIVGGYRKIGDGVVIFVPPLSSTHPQSPEFYFYHMQLASILENLRNNATPDRPEWLNDFQTQLEQQLNVKVSETELHVKKLETAIANLIQDRNIEQLDKNLLVATGDSFSIAVAKALRELGFVVVEGPKQRADLLAWDGSRLAALEVKGLEGGAREKNIGQVNRWTADVSVALSCMQDGTTADTEILAYQIKLGELGIPAAALQGLSDCKGMVILNTHRKLPIDERPESFGEPVTKVAARSEVCVLTGLQLLLVLQSVREDTSRRAEIVDSLFSTNGLFGEALSWERYLCRHARA